MSWGLRSTHILLESGVRSGVVIIDGEKIIDVCDEAPAGMHVFDVEDKAVMAGMVDCHVHLSEPGRTDWDGFRAATQAALCGGVTTMVDMPLNGTPVTTSVSALEEKKAALDQKLYVDIGFWGGVVPGNIEWLEGLMLGGALGCKAFLFPSGNDDFPASDRLTLRDAMVILKRLHVPLLVHAELELDAPCITSDPTAYQSYLESRPAQWEVAAIELLIELCRETGCAVHVVHLSAAEALPMIASAKAEGLPLTVETCPHYLCFSAEEIQDRQTQFKCAPPIREAANRDKLWAGLLDGTIDFIVSAHSSCRSQLTKDDTGNFHEAWNGISSLQMGLPAIWTAAKARGISMERLVPWLSTRPAQLAGISHRKGKLEVGYDADLVVWDPNASFVLQPETLRFGHTNSPYLGRHFDGQIQSVYLRGRAVYHDGGVIGAPIGTQLLRGRL
ncbi:MAG: allantoinase AllB [Myxococcota bacterium]|nr:allantoinase AllB [Myxococcota bacterium]